MAIKRLVFVMLAGTAVTGAGTASAQTRPPVQSQDDTTTQPSAADRDIIVTATRVETSILKTPLAITALTPEQLSEQGITSTDDLNGAAPGVVISSFTQGLQVTVRGIGSQDTSEKGDPSAAFLLDGIYIPRFQGTGGAFYDVARVEILRGPQGTLFGRNSTAGVVNVISRRPTPQFEGGFNASYGNFGTRTADFFVSGPVSDTLMGRFAGSYQRQGNFIIANPASRFGSSPRQRDISFRGQLLWQPTPDFEVLLRGDYSYMNGSNLGLVDEKNFYRYSNAPVPFNFVQTPFGPGPNRPPPALPFGAPTTYFDNSSAARRLSAELLPLKPENRNRYWGVSAEVTWDLGPIVATYIGSHRELTRDEDFTNPVGPSSTSNFLLQTNREDSHELRLATDGIDRLTAQVGAYYFRENGDFEYATYDNDISRAGGTNPFTIQNLFPVPGIRVTALGNLYPKVGARNYSGFGQLTYELIDNVRLTGGARYSNDSRRREGGGTLAQGVRFGTPGDVILPYLAEQKGDAVTWRAGIDWTPSESVLFYAAVATGYKSGGLNDGCLAGTVINGQPCTSPQVARRADQLVYRPERVTSYEAGIKGSLFDRKVRYSLGAYHYDYSDLQLLVSEPTPIPGVSVVGYSNAPAVDVDGVELETTTYISDLTTLVLNGAYNNARYVDYSPFPGFNFAGAKLDRAPKWTASASLTQDIPLGGAQRIRLQVGTRWSDDYVLTSFGQGFQVRQSSFFKSDASIGFGDVDRGIIVQAFVRNIEDTVEINSFQAGPGYIPFPNPQVPGTGAYTYLATGQIGFGAPRTYGVRLSFMF